MKSPLLNLFIPSVLAYAFIVPSGYAQGQKTIKKTIIVTNGDTIINGKRLAEMDKKERERYKKEFNDKEKQQIEDEIDALIKKGKHGEVVVRKFNKADQPEDVLMFRFPDDSSKVSRDSITWNFRRPFPDDRLAMVGDEIRFRGPHHPGDRLLLLNEPHPFIEKLNSQSFNFRNVDKEGFVTEVNLLVGDADKKELKALTGKETNESLLMVDDFTLFPNFSTGKTTLSFSLPTKSQIAVLVSDSENKTVFTDKVNGFSGSYLKQINMSKNGIYHISINQNGKWFVKRIVKN